jgi:hypothetical protein
MKRSNSPRGNDLFIWVRLGKTPVEEGSCASLRISYTLRYSFPECLEEPQLR